MAKPGSFTGRYTPWSECALCGEDHPQDEMVRHKRLGILVDKDCDDELGYADVFAMARLPSEEDRAAEQPVSDQGSQGSFD